MDCMTKIDICKRLDASYEKWILKEGSMQCTISVVDGPPSSSFSGSDLDCSDSVTKQSSKNVSLNKRKVFASSTLLESTNPDLHQNTKPYHSSDDEQCLTGFVIKQGFLTEAQGDGTMEALEQEDLLDLEPRYLLFSGRDPKASLENSPVTKSEEDFKCDELCSDFVEDGVMLKIMDTLRQSLAYETKCLSELYQASYSFVFLDLTLRQKQGYEQKQLLECHSKTAKTLGRRIVNRLFSSNNLKKLLSVLIAVAEIKVEVEKILEAVRLLDTAVNSLIQRTAHIHGCQSTALFRFLSINLELSNTALEKMYFSLNLIKRCTTVLNY